VALIRAVTFDFWNTLFVAVRAGDVRIRQIKMALERNGHADFGVEVIGHAMSLAWQEWDRVWVQERRTFGAEEWVDLLLRELQVTLDRSEQESLVHKMAISGMEANPPPVDGLKGILPYLADSYRLGVICDTGLSPGWMLRDWMETHGILRYFSQQTFSDELGVSKPHPEAFLFTLARLGVSARQAVHVGDYPRTDIAGAKAVGMRAIRFKGVVDWTDDEQAKADAEIQSYDELAPLLVKWSGQNGIQH
jgi:FMN phosphatase YigB (HAD superfamily)